MKSLQVDINGMRGDHAGTPKGSTIGANFSWVFLLLLVMVLLLPACGVLERSFACSTEERAVFAEFPQYGGLQLEPFAASLTGCAAYYDTPAAPEHVFIYFKDQLTAHGWTVEPEFTEFDSSEVHRTRDSGGHHVGGRLIIAHRDGFVYQVMYGLWEFATPPRPGMQVEVEVSKCEPVEACR